MALTLYMHPLASFCHKVLIALYEKDIPFEGKTVDFGNEGSAAPFLKMWPVGKIPVLHDSSGDQIVPETTVIVEYLDSLPSASTPLLPTEKRAQLDARLWDRFYDNYVQVPMQKIVADKLRPATSLDPFGVKEARESLRVAYDMVEEQMKKNTWAIGEQFSVADCAAAPALFYSGFVEPFESTHPNLSAYFERLLGRKSFQRVLKEAQPFFKFYPYRDLMPSRFFEKPFV